MTHSDILGLIKDAVSPQGGVWADFGSGRGAFTLALRDLGGESIKIYSVDKDSDSLDQQRELFIEMFTSPDIHYLYQDFTEELSLPPLDGILMANSLHFQPQQVEVLKSFHKYLKPQGKLLLVEYNDPKSNKWVPYPVAFNNFIELATKAGFEKPTLMHTIPSTFMDEMYAAITTRSHK